MAGALKIQIKLSEIPQSYVKEVKFKDGSTDMVFDVVVQKLKQTDRYGNTHTVYLDPLQEDKEHGAPRIYIGKGFTLFDENGTFVGRRTKGSPTFDDSNVVNDDLPY